MAIHEKSSLHMKGSMGNVSVYKREDIDRLIVRVKGGPRGKSVLKAHSFARKMELNNE